MVVYECRVSYSVFYLVFLLSISISLSLSPTAFPFFLSILSSTYPYPPIPSFFFPQPLTLPTLPRQNYILGSESPTYSPADPLTDFPTDRPELYIQTDVNDLRIDIPSQSSQCQGKNNTDDNMEVVSTDSI